MLEVAGQPAALAPELPGYCRDLRDGERKPIESDQESHRCAYGDERDDRREHAGREATSHVPSMLTGATCGHARRGAADGAAVTTRRA